MRGHLSTRPRAVLLLLILFGMALRVTRLDWQPLWWDEGYSVYFATASLGDMMQLTAHDIHPPLYYALLHGWYALAGDTGPVTARYFSVFWGVLTLPLIARAAATFYPARRWLPVAAVLLLVANPMHLYYSQEVRMYALALPTTLAATIAYTHLLRRVESGVSPWAPAGAYVISATLALATLYYSALLLLSHQVWALLTLRGRPARLGIPVLAGLATLGLQLPWLLYAVPKLIPYIAGKVVSDQDSPLAPWTYLWRHTVAFVAGHLPAAEATWEWLRIGAVILVLGVIALGVRRQHRSASDVRAQLALATLLGIPLLLGFLINLRFPFFPTGGERLLLTVLPYGLILAAVSVTAWTDRRIASAATALLLIPSAAGCLITLGVPRYVEHDYRPIIRFIAERGRDQDSVFAIFPWQVGYWRAYSPRTATGEWLAPQPASLDQTALLWSPELRDRLDAGLRTGVVWFPAPLSFGSTLPAEIETYLQDGARLLENRWFSPATRVSAWVTLPTSEAPPQAMNAHWDALELAAARVAPQVVAAANDPLAVDLVWRGATPNPDLRASLRLIDADGTVWAQRDITPIAANTTPAGDAVIESQAFAIPVAVVPGEYTLALGLSTLDDDQLIPPLDHDENAPPWVNLGPLTVVAPDPPATAQRLPLHTQVLSAVELPGLRLLGAEPFASTPLLAGTAAVTAVYWQTTAPDPADKTFTFAPLEFVLFDAHGSGPIAQFEPALSAVAAPALPSDTLLRQPGVWYIPADTPAGDYRVALRVVASTDPGNGYKVGNVTIIRRAQNFTPISPRIALDSPVQFGTHIQLIGYQLDLSPDGAGITADLALTWHVLQTLLPPHAIFVHAIDAQGQRIAQHDGPPHTASGVAPSGSWLPDEWLVTHHRLHIPAAASTPVSLQVGLYLPATLVRLPASAAGQPIGDAAPLPWP